MYEWDKSEVDVQAPIRAFVDKEIRPLRHELEFGTLPPPTSFSASLGEAAWSGLCAPAEGVPSR